jgi:hypothetical protein
MAELEGLWERGREGSYRSRAGVRGLSGIESIWGPVLPQWAKDCLQQDPLQGCSSMQVPGSQVCGSQSPGAGPRGCILE